MTELRQSAASLRERALLATPISVTISDPTQRDNPLVWVNPAFTTTTGYSAAEALGRNFRFLQGPDTDSEVVAEIRGALEERRTITATLLNYRKDGSEFWNELSVSPVRNDTGAVTHFVGVQMDVTARVHAQQSRDEAMSQLALAADRLVQMGDFTTRMARSQQPEAMLEMLARALTPRVGSWSAVFTFDEQRRLPRPVLMHERQDRDPKIAAIVDDLRRVLPEQLPHHGPIARVLRGEVGYVHLRDYDSAPIEITGAADDDRTALMRQLGLRSMIVVPLQARSDILGCVAIIADQSRRPLGDGELALVRDLAGRAALMLENTFLYARERAAATTLQRSLLPRLPRIDGMEIAAAYVPAADRAAVGGDWYDVFALGGNQGVAVVVGDVMGHNYDSAARMGKLSTIVRAYAWPGGDPRSVLTAADELIAGSGLDLLATCFCAKLVMRAGGATVRYSSAGHPSALARRPDGTVEPLDGGHGTMLGVSRLLSHGSSRPPDAEVALARGSTLVCFTDGLIDAYSSAELDIDAGLARMQRIIADLPVDAAPQAVIAGLTGATPRASDDVAVVALRIG